MEVWIRTNRRAAGLALLLPLLMTVAGALLWWYATVGWPSIALRVVGIIVFSLGALALAALSWAMWMPRVAYRNGKVLFFMQLGAPIAVPVDAVEIFLVGKTGAHVGPAGEPHEVQSVIARIRDRAKEYRERSVYSSFGTWQDGYVMIRGTWCEPVCPDLLKRLNRRLHELHREQAAGTA